MYVFFQEQLAVLRSTISQYNIAMQNQLKVEAGERAKTRVRDKGNGKNPSASRQPEICLADKRLPPKKLHRKYTP